MNRYRGFLKKHVFLWGATVRKLKFIRICVVGLAAVLIATALAGCGKPLQSYSSEFYAMDTVIMVTVNSNDSQKAAEVLLAVEAEFNRIANLTSRFGETMPDPLQSDIYRINAGAGSPVEVSVEIIMLISHALEMNELSGGAFDITLGGISDLWNFKNPELSRKPSDAELAEALKHVGADKIVCDAASSTVMVEKGTVLDFGAVAKGYATDCAAEIIRKSGIKSALVNAGGNVYVIGSRIDKNAWLVGIRHPRDEENFCALVNLTDCTIVTSGDDQRYFIHEGVRYHHILDPKTGFPSTSGCTSVSIIGQSSLYADMFSTAAFVLGMEEFSRLFPEVEYIAFDKEINISASPGVMDKLR